MVTGWGCCGDGGGGGGRGGGDALRSIGIMTPTATSFPGTLTLTFYVTKDGGEACRCRTAVYARERYLASDFPVNGAEGGR